MKNWRLLTLLALLPLLAMFGACSSDDGTAPPEEEDETAPLVVQVAPAQDATDVSVGAALEITFNEDMDQDSANGNVNLSNGIVSGYDWTDARTLTVGHTAWDEGVEVTATVGTGLTDEAGNALAEAFSWSFWTYTDDVQLLNTLPDDGDTGVALNAQIWLEFSEDMNAGTLPGAITISSPDKAFHTYTLDGDDEHWTLTPDDNLPASTEITVTVTTDARSVGGDPLAAESSFSFTTGIAPDETPPNLLSIEPAHGSSIPTSTSYIRLTFDEPVEDDSLQPSTVSGQLMMALSNQDGDVGVWSENHTVFTIGLDTPLVPGAILAADFDSYADMHGNVQTTPFEWSVTVAGDAEFYPVIDEIIKYYAGIGTDGDKAEYEVFDFQRIEVLSGGLFRVWSGWWDDVADVFTWEDYDSMEATSSAIRFLGFHESDKDYDVTFVPAIDWLRLPVGDDTTWAGEADFTPAPGPGEPDRVVYAVHVDPDVYDLESEIMFDKDPEDPTLIWKGCRIVTINFTLYDDAAEYATGQDQYWYCPGIGAVRYINFQSDGVDSYTEEVNLYWMGFEEDIPSD